LLPLAALVDAIFRKDNDIRNSIPILGSFERYDTDVIFVVTGLPPSPAKIHHAEDGCCAAPPSRREIRR
jgi:hypothetical protein